MCRESDFRNPRATELGAALLTHARCVVRMEEELTLAHRSGPRESYATVTLGVNSDSLATWFFDAVSPALRAERLLLDLIIENEHLTFTRLQRAKYCAASAPAPGACQAARSRVRLKSFGDQLVKLGRSTLRQ